MLITDEDVDEMVAILKLAGVYDRYADFDLKRVVREKLEEGKVPCFESRRWVKREKQHEMV